MIYLFLICVFLIFRELIEWAIRQALFNLFSKKETSSFEPSTDQSSYSVEEEEEF